MRETEPEGLMKESYRFFGKDLKTGYDLIFIARNSINSKKQYDVDKSMRNAVNKAKLFKG